MAPQQLLVEFNTVTSNLGPKTLDYVEGSSFELLRRSRRFALCLYRSTFAVLDVVAHVKTTSSNPSEKPSMLEVASPVSAL